MVDPYTFRFISIRNRPSLLLIDQVSPWLTQILSEKDIYGSLITLWGLYKVKESKSCCGVFVKNLQKIKQTVHIF